ncbi:MAG: hypothetical protein K9J06_12335 [Flavobacteriales bacterium]|nr:hypothetical protein [Flavobacteriales bacterium]
MLTSTGDACAQGNATTGRDTVKSNIVGPLDFKGIVEELGKTIKGAIVTVYEDADGTRDQLKEIKKLVTSGNGEFAVKFEINKFYLITVEKGGYTTKGIDVDTDVRLARPQYTKVPAFEFKVDMVKDTDGLAFKKSVASVFYQIKRNSFDYELDYSKEEMEEEERLIREQEERQKLAELAAQKKFEMEEAAKLLRDSDDASMEEKLKAAITVGNEDRVKTVSTITEIFPVNDTLRAKKADLIYSELQKERKKEAKSSDINFKALLASAQALEVTSVTQAEKEQARKAEELHSVKLEAERQKEAAMMVQQQALELEMREKIAAANLVADQTRAKEEQEKNDKLYYAIFNSSGDGKLAVANIVKSFPKGDQYAEQKAQAIYAEYEKMRLSGSTLAKMNFSKLFSAADLAEQKAVKEEIDKADAKDRVKTEAYLKREQEQKAEQERKASDAIIQGLKAAAQSDAAQMAVFVESFSKTDPYRTQKGQAMFEEYVEQQKAIKKTGSTNAPLNFGAIFAAATIAEKQAEENAKLQTFKEKETEQAKLEKLREEVRQDKIRLGEQAAKQAEQVQNAKLNEAKTKREKDVGQALEAGGGDRDRTVQALIKTFPKGTELTELKAQAMYDAYMQESAKIRKTGSVGAKLDFSVLFQAAEQAELIALQRENEEKLAKEDANSVAYEAARIEKAKSAAIEVAQEAKKDLAVAETNYEATAKKVEEERVERMKEQVRAAEELEKQKSMALAQREAAEREKEEQVLARLEAERKERLSKEEAEKERVAAAKLEEQRKAEALAKAEAEQQFALAEKERQVALAAQRKAEEDRQREEAKRQAAEAAAKAEADLLAAKAEKQRQAAEQAAKAEAERLAAAAEQARANEEQRRTAQAEQERIVAEQAAAKAQAELKRQEELAAAAAIKAEEDRIRNEMLAAEAAAKAERERIRQAELAAAAAAKAEEEKIRKETLAAEAAAKAEQERIRQAELAAVAAEKKKRENQIASKLADAKRSSEGRKYDSAVDAYREVLKIDPSNKEAQAGLATAESALQALAKAESEKRALDEKYDRLISKGEGELASGAFANARKSFNEAATLKPNDPKAKENLVEVKRREDEFAAAEEERAQRERQFVVLMQEGNRAMGANNLAVAKLRYTEASKLKPEESEPKSKLSQIAQAEQEIAMQEEEKRKREEDAKKKFEEQQQAAELARAEAVRNADAARNKDMASATSVEEQRAKEFDRIKADVEKLNLNAEDQRKAFLSELSKLYPQGVTEETVEAKNYRILRHVHNQSGVVTVYEQRTWDWGGIFWFKNGDINITESLYKLELGKMGK